MVSLDKARSSISDLLVETAKRAARDTAGFFVGDTSPITGYFVGERVASRIFGNLENALDRYRLDINPENHVLNIDLPTLSVRRLSDPVGYPRFDLLFLGADIYLGRALKGRNNKRPGELEVELAYGHCILDLRNPILYMLSDDDIELEIGVYEYLDHW